MISPVITTLLRIKVMPLRVIRGHPHFLWITVIQALIAPVVFLSPVVLWVVHIGIVIKTIPVVMTVSTAPNAAISPFLSLSV